MEDKDDKVLEAWAESSDVTPQTLRFLKEEGFTSMRMLSRLTPDEIDKAFQGPRLLPLAQCLALKEAVKKLTGETAAPAPAPAPASPPAPAPAPAPVPAPAFAPEAPDRREQENLVGWRPAEFQVFTTRDAGPSRQTGNDGSLEGNVPTVSPQRQQRESFPWRPEEMAAERPSQTVDDWHPQPQFPSEQHVTQGYHGYQAVQREQYQGASAPAHTYMRPQKELHAGSDRYPYPEPQAGVKTSAPQAGYRQQVHTASPWGRQGFGGETFRFLLVGKTGAGKSTTGNTILGDNHFTSDIRFDSVTGDCQLKRSTRNGVMIEIMDSPGLFDTRNTHEEISTAIVQAVACMHPGPHAFLYVIKIGRFTMEDEGVYNRVTALFDQQLQNYTMVVFTGGDDLLRSGASIEEKIAKAPENLRKLLKTFKNRYVVFDNMAPNKQPQVDVFLQKVREMVAENGGAPYSCPKYMQVGEGMEEEVARRVAEVEKQDLKKKRFVQELEIKTEQAKEAVAREKEELKKREEARKQEMKEEEEMRRAQFESLKQQLEQQQMSEEKRRQETEAFLRKLEEEKRQQMREMEEERKREKKRLQKKEKEMQEAMEKMIEEQRKQQEERMRLHEEEMRRLKDGIANKKETTFLDKFKSFANTVVNTVIDAAAIFIPFLRR